MASLVVHIHGTLSGYLAAIGADLVHSAQCGPLVVAIAILDSTNEQPSCLRRLVAYATLVHPYAKCVSISVFIHDVVVAGLPATWAETQRSTRRRICNSRSLDHGFCGCIPSRSRLTFVTDLPVFLEFCGWALMSGSSGIIRFPFTLIAKATVFFVRSAPC